MEVESPDKKMAESVDGKPVSKSQMKKLAKRQKWLDRRPEMRRLEKEKRKLKRQQEAQKREAEGDADPAVAKRPRIKLMSESENKFRVVIDLDFNEFMTEDEMAKAAKQVSRIYSLNRHSENPCQLYLSSLHGKIRDRFDITSAGYKNWDVNISERDYTELFDNENCDTQVAASDGRLEPDESRFVYLSGDSENTLPDVETLLTKYEDKIFVIGGLVDHNRHKNLCQQRALERNIPTAKLPLQGNVKLSHRHILSTVTVFEILLKVFAQHKSWQEALLATIPKRKLAEEQPRGTELQEREEECKSETETIIKTAIP